MNQDVDCVVRVRAKVNGQPVLLEEERVSVVVVRPDASREDATVTGVEGDAVRLHLGHDLLTQTGIYRLEVWLNRGGSNQMIGDRPAAFQLVPLSTQACDVADVYELGEVDMDFINPFVEVVDNLDSESGTAALSARQGGELKRMIAASTPKTGGGLEVKDGRLQVKVTGNNREDFLKISSDGGIGLNIGPGLYDNNGELCVGSGIGINVEGYNVSVRLDSSSGIGVNPDTNNIRLNLDTVTLETRALYDAEKQSYSARFGVRIDTRNKYNALTYDNEIGLSVKLSHGFLALESGNREIIPKTGDGLTWDYDNGLILAIGSHSPIVMNSFRKLDIQTGPGIEKQVIDADKNLELKIHIDTITDNALQLSERGLSLRIGPDFELNDEGKLQLRLSSGLNHIDDKGIELQVSTGLDFNEYNAVYVKISTCLKRDEMTNAIYVDVEELKRLLLISSNASEE